MRLQMQHPEIYQEYVTVSESRRFYKKVAESLRLNFLKGGERMNYKKNRKGGFAGELRWRL